MFYKKIILTILFILVTILALGSFNSQELGAETYAPTDVAYEDSDGTLWTYDDIFSGTEEPLSNFTAMDQESIVDNGDGTYTIENTALTGFDSYGILYQGSDVGTTEYFVSFKPLSLNYANHSSFEHRMRINAYSFSPETFDVWLQTRNTFSTGDSGQDGSWLSIETNPISDLSLGDSFTIEDSVLLVDKSKFATAPTEEQMTTWSYRYLNPTTNYDEPVDNPTSGDDVAYIDYESNTSYTYNDIFSNASLSPTEFSEIDSSNSTVTYNSSDFTISMNSGSSGSFFGIRHSLSPGLDRYYFSYKMESLDYSYSDNSQAYRVSNYTGTDIFKDDDVTNRQYVGSPFDLNISSYSDTSYPETVEIFTPSDSYTDLDSFTVNNDMFLINLSSTFTSSVEGDYPSYSELYDLETTYRSLENVYEVTFEDYDGSILKTEYVNQGQDATPPVDPTHPDYNFTGWDGSYTNITSDTNIKATYDAPDVTLTYYDWDGTINSTETVAFGFDGTPPSIGDPNYEGFTFDKWQDVYFNVETDTDVYPEYTVDRSTHIPSDVAYLDYDGTTYTYNELFDNTNIDLSEFAGQQGSFPSTLEELEDGTYRVSPSQDGNSRFGLEYENTQTTNAGNYYTSFTILEQNFTPTVSNNFILSIYDGAFQDLNVPVNERFSTVYDSLNTNDTILLRTGLNSNEYTTSDNFVIDNSMFVKYLGDFANEPTHEDMDDMLAIYLSTVEYTVTFEDHDGTIIDTQLVSFGESATPPSDPTRQYMVFDGWQGDYEYVTSDRIVTATYVFDRENHTIDDVGYIDGDGTPYTYRDIMEGSRVDLEEFTPVTNENIELQLDGHYKVEGPDTSSTRFGIRYEDVSRTAGTYYLNFRNTELNFGDERFTLNLFDGQGVTIDVTENARNSFIQISDGASDDLLIRSSYSAGGYDSTDNYILENSIYLVKLEGFVENPTQEEMDEITGVYNSETLKSVEFKDYDETLVKTQYLTKGEDAVAPEVRNENMTFLNWSNSYTNVQEDTITIAQYHNDYYYPEVDTPYFHYTSDYEDPEHALSYLNFTITTDYEGDFEVAVYELDTNGERLEQIYSDTSTFVGEGNYTYSFDGDFSPDFPYEVVVNGDTIRKGYVKPWDDERIGTDFHEDLTGTNSKVWSGDSIYEQEGLLDFNVTTREHYALHYYLQNYENSDIIRTKRITEVNFNSEFSVETLSQFATVGFIPLTVDNKIPEYIDQDILNLYTNFISENEPKVVGIHNYEYYSDIDGIVDESYLFVDNNDYLVKFETDKNEYIEGRKVTMEIIVPNEDFRSYFDMIALGHKESVINDVLPQVKETGRATIEWTAPVNNIYVSQLRLSGADIGEYSVSNAYNTVPPTPIDDQFDEFLGGMGINSGIYKIIFSLVAIFTVVIILAFLRAGLASYLISGALLLITFIVWGLFPAWVVLIMGTVLFVMILTFLFNYYGGTK